MKMNITPNIAAAEDGQLDRCNGESAGHQPSNCGEFVETRPKGHV
jgi:hypothetical protein